VAIGRREVVVVGGRRGRRVAGASEASGEEVMRVDDAVPACESEAVRLTPISRTGVEETAREVEVCVAN